MIALRVAFAIGAVLSAICSMGFWLLLQLGGITRAEGPRTAVVVYLSAALFIGLAAISAYVQERTSGPRMVTVKCLFLIGAYGLAAIAPFGVGSRGMVLQLPEVVLLIILFVCLILIFWRRNWSEPEDNQKW